MMPINVQGPDGVSVSFPDGTGSDTINSVMSQHFSSTPPQEKNGPETSGFRDLFQSFPRGFLKGLANTATAAGRASQIEMGEPITVPNVEQAMGVVERKTGPMHKPETFLGRIGEGGGEVLGNPTTYLGPAGFVSKLLGGAASAVGGEVAGEIAKGTRAEPIARAAGSIAGFNIPSAGASAGRFVRPRQIPTAPAPAQLPPSPRVPREGLSPNVRLLPADFSHAAQGRASVGAAGHEGVLQQISPEAREQLRNIVREQGFNEHTVDARLEEMSPHQFLAELTPDLEGHLGAIRSLPGAARNEITQTVRQRATEGLDRIRNTFDRAFGEAGNQTQWERDIQRARAQEAAPFWQRFNETVITPSPEIDAIMARLSEAGALGAANKSLRIAGRPTAVGFGDTQVPTSEAFQLVKEHLDDLISTNIRSGANKAAARYTQLKNDLVNAIDNHPDPNVAGVWREARQSWARHSALLSARELGEEALTSSVRADEIPQMIQGMSDAERRAFVFGVRGRLEQIAGNPGRVEQRLLNEVMSRRNQEKIVTILGEDRANELFRAVELEQQMHGSPTRVLYGSPTAERRAYQQRWQPGEPLGGVSPEDAMHAVAHPVATALKAGARRIMGARSAAEEQRLQGVRDEVARVLTLQGPERDAVLRALMQ